MGPVVVAPAPTAVVKGPNCGPTLHCAESKVPPSPEKHCAETGEALKAVATPAAAARPRKSFPVFISSPNPLGATLPTLRPKSRYPDLNH
jgi:hypothetical protein